jgi:hypothetical protein
MNQKLIAIRLGVARACGIKLYQTDLPLWDGRNADLHILSKAKTADLINQLIKD